MNDHVNVCAGSMSGQSRIVTDVDLSAYGNVAPSYQHHDRFITAGDPLILPEAYLRWYELRHGDERVPSDLVVDARSMLTQEVSNGRIAFDYGLGFVVLHFSPPLVYLIVGSWRANQEFWETFYIRDLGTCEPFKPVEPGKNDPTLCVGELAPVWHERRAWTRFLYSTHDIGAKRLRDSNCFSGRV